MPEGEELPDEVFCHVIAQAYHISPLEVERWTFYEKRRYICILGESGAGVEYRQKVNNFQNQPNEFEVDGW